MNNLSIEPHVLNNNNDELLQSFFDSINNMIINKQPTLQIALNYINEKKRQQSLRNIIQTNNELNIYHICSEGISNYYHYKSLNNIVYFIKENICDETLYNRLMYCIENTTNIL